jgi:protein-S-isoprenylcysteine O-methyltransferase Ste14
MTPEHKAEHPLGSGGTGNDAPGDAAASGDITMPKWVAAAGTAVFFVFVYGGGIVFGPWALTGWQAGPPYPVAVRVLGVVLIAAGTAVFAWAHVRYATEGVGIPLPQLPTSQRVTVGGPYRYVRNPMYVAAVAAITGQALLLCRPVLFVYAAVFLAVAVVLVYLHEEPELRRRYGAQYEAYCKQVPAWWPRLRRRPP